MDSRFDISVLGSYGTPLAIVEVKARANTTAAWARRTRYLMLHGNDFPATAYFLLVTTDRLYLWPPGVGDVEVYPMVDVPVESVLRPVAKRIGRTVEGAGGEFLELLAELWLGELVDPAAEPAPDGTWLAQSGFGDAIRRGRVAVEAVA